MNQGDVIESAIWITGEETEELRQRFKSDVALAIAALCHDEGWLHGPVTFVEKRPGDDMVPPVPNHISGPRVRLLVAEAIVTDKALETSKGSFVANLDRKDLKRLREITRRKWSDHHSGEILSNDICDKWIEQLGPEAAIETLRISGLH
jgi:hypothetical protein